MPSVFPEHAAGGLDIRDGAGNPVHPPDVVQAYSPAPGYVTSCPITALPSNCEARIEPQQINAIVSELTSFAECLDPNGPWDCTSLKNICTSFQAWYATQSFRSYGDGVSILGAGSTVDPFRVGTVDAEGAPTVLIRRTATANSPPTSLQVGELFAEMNVPPRLWVGVPTSIDASGKKLLADSNAYALRTELGSYVLKSGDDMTGGLRIKTTNPYLDLKKATSGGQSVIYGSLNDLARWTMALGDTGLENGANAGSDFRVIRYNDAGAGAGTPLLINRATGRLTTDNITIASPSTVSEFKMEAVNASVINAMVFSHAGIRRWQVNADPNDYILYRCNSSGAAAGIPLSVSNATGHLTLEVQPNQPNHAATKSYVDSVVGTGGPGYLPLTGGTLSGALALDIPGVPPTLTLNKNIDTNIDIAGKKNNNLRWTLQLGNSVVEGGSNTGSWFVINRFDDAGTRIDSPIIINRGDGRVVLGSGDPTQPTHAVTKNYADALVINKVSKAGDTMSGPLIVPVKGNHFGGASGTSAGSVVSVADANIKLYDNTGGNWAGIGTDSGGNMWFRTGLTGSTPVPALWISSTNYAVSLAQDPTAPMHVCTKQYADLKAARYGNETFGDLTTSRNGAPTTGILNFGNVPNTKYLHCDGTQFVLEGGPLFLTAAPTTGNHATTRTYVDNLVSNAAFLPKAGGTMTGMINTAYSSRFDVPTNTGTIQILANGVGHVAMTFFDAGIGNGANFGWSTGDQTFYMGGISLGSGVAYKFLTTREIPTTPITDVRLTLAGTTTGPGSGLEPWPGGVVVGADGGIYRVRYLQFNIGGTWYTAATLG